MEYNDGKYSKIYIYEPDKSNFNMAKERMKKYDRLVFREASVGSENAVVRFNAMSCRSSHVGEENTTINIVPLDLDIDDQITFIKMDIEGIYSEFTLQC